MNKLFPIYLLFLVIQQLPAQKHYIWPAEANKKEYGRVIDIIEIVPGVVAYQGLYFNNQWQTTNLALGTLDLISGTPGFIDTLGNNGEWYRPGFGKLADTTIVIAYNTKLGYQLSHYKYNKTNKNFNLGSTISIIEYSFPAESAGICTLKAGGYAAAILYKDNELNKLDCRLVLLNDENAFKKPPIDYLKVDGVTLITKPRLINILFNYGYSMNQGNLSYMVDQLVETPDGNIIAFCGYANQSKGIIPKMYAFNNKLELQWEATLSTTGYGFKPLAAGKQNIAYVTCYTKANAGYSITTISGYKKNIKSEILNCTIDSFEANGSFVMADNNLCIYGFGTHYNHEENDYGNKYPAFYILDGKNLKVMFTWELNAKDEPSTKLAEKFGSGIVAPGKFYSGTQLTDGSLLFGGHVLARLMQSENKFITLFCNYAVKFSPAEWKKKY